MKREITDLLIALNSTIDTFGSKYPIGNKELTEKVMQFERLGFIRYNNFKGIWERNK